MTNLLYLASRIDDLPPSASELLQSAEEELRRVVHITRQALGFYRETVSAEPVAIGTLLELSIDLLQGKIVARRALVEKQWRLPTGHGSCRRVEASFQQPPCQQP